MFLSVILYSSFVFNDYFLSLFLFLECFCRSFSYSSFVFSIFNRLFSYSSFAFRVFMYHLFSSFVDFSYSSFVFSVLSVIFLFLIWFRGFQLLFLSLHVWGRDMGEGEGWGR